MFKKIISLFLSLSLIITQSIFAQGVAQLNLAQYLGKIPALGGDNFRPTQLRYFSYDNLNNSFSILLDKGDAKDIKDNQLKEQAKELMDYFLIGLTLPNDAFWVNLRPDSPDNIIDPELEKTDLGRILLEADLQLKKDTSGLTSPQTPEGKQYWDKLYKKAEELFPAAGGSAFGGGNITIPTITRPWIVPGEIIVRESGNSVYIYKANLKVMLEADHLTGRGERPFAPTSGQYAFSDPRLKELNEYSSRIIRETIIPKLTQEINSGKRYAKLRQVYYSLVLSRWFKMRFAGKSGQYADQIDRHNLTNLTAKEPYDKLTYFKQYQGSFAKGEYNLKEPVYTPYGQSIRTYMSGGFFAGDEAIKFSGVGTTVGSSIVEESFKNHNTVALEISGDQIKLAGNQKQPKALAASPLSEIEKKNAISVIDFITKSINVTTLFSFIENGISIFGNKGNDDYRWLRKEWRRIEKMTIGYNHLYDKAGISKAKEEVKKIINLTLGDNLRPIDQELTQIFIKAAEDYFSGVIKNMGKDFGDVSQIIKHMRDLLNYRKNKFKDSENYFNKFKDMKEEEEFLNGRKKKLYNLIWSWERPNLEIQKEEYLLVLAWEAYEAEKKGMGAASPLDIQKEIDTFRRDFESYMKKFSDLNIEPKRKKEVSEAIGGVYDSVNGILSKIEKDIKWGNTLKAILGEYLPGLYKARNDFYVRAKEIYKYSPEVKNPPVKGSIERFLNSIGLNIDILKSVRKYGEENRKRFLENIPPPVINFQRGLEKLLNTFNSAFFAAPPLALENEVERIQEVRGKLNAYHSGSIKDFLKVYLSDLIASVNGTAEKTGDNERKEWVGLAEDLSGIRAKVEDNIETYKEKLEDFYANIGNNPGIKLSEDQQSHYTKYAQTIKAMNDPDEIIAAAEQAHKLVHGSASPVTLEKEVEKIREAISALSKRRGVFLSYGRYYPLSYLVEEFSYHAEKLIPGEPFYSGSDLLSGDLKNIVDNLVAIQKGVRDNIENYQKALADFYEGIWEDFSGAMNGVDVERLNKNMRSYYRKYAQNIRKTDDPDKIIQWAERAYDLVKQYRDANSRNLALFMDMQKEELARIEGEAFVTIQGIFKTLESDSAGLDKRDLYYYRGMLTDAVNIIGSKSNTYFYGSSDYSEDILEDVNGFRDRLKGFMRSQENVLKIIGYSPDGNIDTLSRDELLGIVSKMNYLLDSEQSIITAYPDFLKELTAVIYPSRNQNTFLHKQMPFGRYLSGSIQFVEKLIVSLNTNLRGWREVSWLKEKEEVLNVFSGVINELKSFEGRLKQIAALPVTSVSSAIGAQKVVPAPKRGGIDFTDRALKIGLERMGSFASSVMVLPEIADAAAIDLDKEFKQIQLMASSGIRPSDTRILEFEAACYYRGEFSQRLGEITACIQQAHFLDERLGRESSEALRLATILPEVM